MKVSFHTDGEPFLREAGDFLAGDPLRYSVIATNAARPRPAASDRPFWFASILDEGRIVAAAMRTHPDPPHAGFAPHMALDAVAALADALAARRESVPAWNGDLPTARALCEAFADGSPVEVVMHTRLFEAREVIWPPRPSGELRRASAADEDLVVAWWRAFHHDAETQGGRRPDPACSPDVDAIRRRIAAGSTWLWEVDGAPVNMTVAHPVMFGSSRIGPVYTPPEHRGRGYAAWVVALLTQQILDAGARPCLYTDQANPISNKVYERIGYERVQDEGNVIVRR